MGVYVRKDSPFFWFLLERPGQKPIKESSKIPRNDVGGKYAAQHLYALRMGEMAMQRHFDQRHLKAAQSAPAELPSSLVSDGAVWCYLYCVRRGDMVKIGRTNDVRRRLQTLQTSHPEVLTLLASAVTHQDVERLVHRRFAHLRLRGEWFQLEESLRTFIDGLARGLNPVALLDRQSDLPPDA